MKFRTKLTLWIAAVLFGVTLAFFSFFLSLARDLATERIEERAQALAQNLAANSGDAVYNEDLYKQLAPLLKGLLNTPDMVAASVLDASGRTLASAGTGSPAAAKAGWSGSGRGMVFTAVAEIYSPAKGLVPKNKPIGTARLAFSFERLAGRIRRMVLQSMSFAVLVIILGMGISVFFANRLTRPMMRILEADEAVVRGDAENSDIPEAEIPADEVGRIIRSRSAMIATLLKAEGKMRGLLEAERFRAAELEKAYAELKGVREQLTQAEKLSMLGQVLSGVAHEINNPLTGIMGLSALLLKEELVLEQPQIREDLFSILQEARRCQEVVKGLTGFARKHKPEKVCVSINELIEQSLKLAAPQLKKFNILVRQELAPESPRTMADYHQLQQVLMNLIINAQQSMTEFSAGGTLMVRTRLEGSRIIAEVEDDGPGILPENLPRLFKPFFTTKEPGKGTGLGLSLSYGIISEHGGGIKAESRPGKGALFIIELPAGGEIADGAKEPGPAAPLPAGLNVLVIDDEITIRNVFVRVLRFIDCVPDTAADGEEAVEKLKVKTYDAVYCDMRMPRMGGRELYRWVCENKPEFIPKWIFMTGSVAAEGLTHIDEETGRPCLRKPFSPDTVQQSLRNLLGDALR